MTVVIESDKIGKNFRLGQYSIIRECATIGDDVEIAEHCVIGCKPLSFNKESMRTTPVRDIPKGSITIGNNVFINSHSDVVTALEGVTIIEDNVIMGQRVIVGHDSHVHKNVQLMNAVVLNGYVTIGEYTMVGAGAIVRNRINIGKNCIIGQGSNVIKDIPDNSLAYGNPCIVQGSNTLVAKAVKKITKEIKRVM